MFTNFAYKLFCWFLFFLAGFTLVQETLFVHFNLEVASLNVRVEIDRLHELLVISDAVNIPEFRCFLFRAELVRERINRCVCVCMRIHSRIVYLSRRKGKQNVCEAGTVCSVTVRAFPEPVEGVSWRGRPALASRGRLGLVMVKDKGKMPLLRMVVNHFIWREYMYRTASPFIGFLMVVSVFFARVFPLETVLPVAGLNHS